MEILENIEANGRTLACVRHIADSNRMVIFCHGFRGNKIGPNRLFVTLARRLALQGVNSLRFDQYGSGDSPGDYAESLFNDWVITAQLLAGRYVAQGLQVALLGQSMGGSAALVAAVKLGAAIASVVAWVPDPCVDPPRCDGFFMEEAGQRVSWDFWRQAHSAEVPKRFREVVAPTYVLLASDDELVNAENQKALVESVQPRQRVEVLPAHCHSAWSFEQANDILNKTTDFIQSNFDRPSQTVPTH